MMFFIILNHYVFLFIISVYPITEFLNMIFAAIHGMLKIVTVLFAIFLN